MDTDELTPMAYKIILLAEGEQDTLQSEIGASASNYKDEEDFLRSALNDIEEIIEDPEEYLDSWNLLDANDDDEFKKRLNNVKNRF